MSGEATQKKALKYDTKAIKLGFKPAVTNNYSIMPPIGLTTSYEQDDPATDKGYLYIRKNNPMRETLEKGIAELEDSKYCLCFSSGTSALNGIVTLLNTGDHIVSAEVIFGGSYRYFEKITARMGITTTYVDPTDVQNVEKAIQENTKLVFLETPANPHLSVYDIAKVAEAAHKKKEDVVVAVDNTFLTSYFQKPLSLGVDVVMYSLTKYMNGHTDVCMGALCFNEDSLLPRLRYIQNNAGLSPSPFDCYLVYRGLKTLPIRMRQHMKIALKIAQFLESHPLVEKVLHPLLPSHPQYELTKRQTTGHSGMVAFYVKGGLKETSDLLKKFKVINLAASLGGVESLVMVPAVLSHASFPQEDRLRLGITDNLVRLSVGLEDVDDLREDLDQALHSTLA
ncbi:putative cystathionine gamma-lyase 2 [Periplaneta americana]|uniref:putative cystathionine gamma-lyase 2 n=1 Tax=Periplaneta americana TaxID=6978 RepID=UPI0037E72F16